MTTENRIYVSVLADYNNGEMHGNWIDATSDVDAMWSEVNALLRTSKYPNVIYRDRKCLDCEHEFRSQVLYSEHTANLSGEASCYCPECKSRNVMSEPQYASAEEFAIHDHEGEALQGIGEYTPLSEIATRIEAAELAEAELGDDGPAIVAAYWDNVGGRPDDAKEAVETAHEHYHGQFDSWEKFADDYLESTGMLEALPEWAQPYFDSEAYGRDMRLSGDFFENNGYYFSS